MRMHYTKDIFISFSLYYSVCLPIDDHYHSIFLVVVSLATNSWGSLWCSQTTHFDDSINASKMECAANMPYVYMRNHYFVVVETIANPCPSSTMDDKLKNQIFNENSMTMLQAKLVPTVVMIMNESKLVDTHTHTR